MLAYYRIYMQTKTRLINSKVKKYSNYNIYFQYIIKKYLKSSALMSISLTDSHYWLN